MDLFKRLLLIKPAKGDKINKNWFSHKNVPHTAKQCFSVVLKHFWGNSQRTLFIQKIYSQKGTLKYSQSFFFNMFEKGQTLRKILICLNNGFDQTIKSGEILTKMFFSPK